MMKKLTENKFVHAIIAILISIGFWCYVIVGSNPTYTANLSVTNVVYEGLADLTDKGFYFIGELPGKIDIRATGARSLVTRVSDEYSAKIDFTNIKGAGEYNLRVKMETPSGVEVKNIKPKFIKVTIDSGKTKKVGVNVDIFGSKANEFEINPIEESISVSGPSSVISKITDFEVKINTDDIEKTGETMYRATPLDGDGKEVIDEKLTFDNIVKVKIDRIKTVDVIVDESIIPAYIKENYNVSVSVDEQKINIAADDSVLADTDKIEADISTVMLNPSQSPQKAEVYLIAPENTRLANGTAKKVTVTITYEPVDEAED